MARPLLALALLAACHTAGCGACDTTGQEPIEFREGITTSSASGEVWTYESTAVHDDWLHFPAGRIYDLVHGLPGTPQTWSAHVSFKSRLEPRAGSGTTQDPNNAALASGNQVVVDAKWGPEMIRVRNDTCAEVFVRLQATFHVQGVPTDDDALSLEPTD